LKVEGPIVGRLKEIGFDPKRMEPTYTVEVWRKALQVASLEYYPQMSPAAAEFALGSRMVEGYLETLVGKVIQAAMPFLSADSLCMRLPRFFSSGIVGAVKQPEVKKVGEKLYKVTMFGEQGVPWFTAGAVDATLKLTKVKPNVQVDEVKADAFTINITWTV
jgi:uncharacterized protein (TIGR02265 family)